MEGAGSGSATGETEAETAKNYKVIFSCQRKRPVRVINSKLSAPMLGRSPTASTFCCSARRAAAGQVQQALFSPSKPIGWAIACEMQFIAGLWQCVATRTACASLHHGWTPAASESAARKHTTQQLLKKKKL
jgi:hypothetical protein